MPIDLRGKPIVITGASSGIGLATAFACAQAGMPVILAARRLDRLREAEEAILAKGGKALGVACDVAKDDDCTRLIDESCARFGPIYAVFANAGFGHECGIEQATPEQLREIFEVNFWGTVRLYHAALPVLRARGDGHLLACSSCLSKIAMPFFGAYSATKAAQDHISRALRIELAGTGIHVSSVHPIRTRTEFFDETDRRSDPTGKTARKRLAIMQPPERVADAVVACLRRPHGEVWTSTSVRTAMGLATIFPRTADKLLRLALRRRLNRGADAAREQP